MFHSDAPVRNPRPASSQNSSVEALRDGDDRQFNAGIPAEILALRNALFGSNRDSLADATRGQQCISSRSQVDLNIRIEVERRLRTSFGAEFHGAQCDIHEGILILCGYVSNFHTKQLAQEIARKVEGVKFIVNRLRVNQSHLSAALRTYVPFHSVSAIE